MSPNESLNLTKPRSAPLRQHGSSSAASQVNSGVRLIHPDLGASDVSTRHFVGADPDPGSDLHPVPLPDRRTPVKPRRCYDWVGPRLVRPHPLGAPIAHASSSRLTLACPSRAAAHDFFQAECAAHGRMPLNRTVSGSMQPKTTTFRTKVDWWLVGVLVAAVAAMMHAAVLGVRDGSHEGWLGVVGLLSALSVIGAISVPTEYLLTEKHLIVRSGLVRTTIALDSIERVYRTRAVWAAPAWSIDRLRIDYRQGRVRAMAIISPVRQAEFLALLQALSRLQTSGQELVSETVLSA